MCSIKIVIPSFGRAERVYSRNIVKDAIICVPESQFSVYAECNPNSEIVCHPDSVKGLVPKRNWMVQKFGELFMLDDDVIGIQKVYGSLEESSKVCKDADVNTRRILELYDMAKCFGVSLFGFSPNFGPNFYNEFKPIRLDSKITGCAYGVIKSPNTWWPEDLKVKEDFWISGIVKFTERIVLTDNRFYAMQRDTFDSGGGGLSAIRTTESEKESMLKIREAFGTCVTLKRDHFGAKRNSEYNISVKFPY